MSIDLSEANSAVEEWTSTETTVIAVGTSFACETQLQPQPSAFLLLGRTDREVGVPHEVGIAPLWGIEYHEGGEQYFATTGSVEFSEIAASPGETTSGEVQFEAADQMISLLFEAYLCP